MKKKAIKIAASTAVAASAFVAVAPAQQADAATNVTTLATNAQNAGTVLKWAISVEGSADYRTLPTAQYNAAKAAVKAAETAAAKLSATENLSIQAKLVEPKIQIQRAMSYIDAINSSTKIVGLTNTLDAAIKSGDLGQVEKAYHSASFEFKTKQAKLLDRVYGQSTRDGIRNAVKPAMEAALESVKYDVTVKMHLDKASALIKENKLVEAAAELAKADYNLKLKDAKFTFKTQLEKSYADVAAALPLQPLSATSDGANTVTVKFSKVYDTTLTTLEAGQFKVSGETVQSAKLSDDKKSVILTTSNLDAGKDYTVTWKGYEVKFSTDASKDTSGIAVNQTDVAYLEATQNRTYEATLTNADGTAYVGSVKISLATSQGAGVIASVNGVNQSAGANTATVRTDVNGKLVFNVESSSQTLSALKVVPTVEKLDGTAGKRSFAATYFYPLQLTDTKVTASDIETRLVSSRIDTTNDYVYLNNTGIQKKFKWDGNDLFFIAGVSVSQDAFEKALSRGDDLSIDYKAKADEKSQFNITNNQTLAEGITFTNPANDDVRFDGSNYDLSGEGDAGYTVKVYKGTDFVGSTVVGSDGTWTLKAVNLTQNAANTFTGYLLPAGKDNSTPWNGTNVEDKGSVTVYEGAFASTGIALNDQGDAGLSVNDTLDFTFLNNDKSFGHEFKKDLKGTITVNDNLSRKAVYDVEYVDGNTVKVVKVVSSETGYQPNSRTTIESTTGLVNQDELAYNVAESKSKGTTTIGSTPGVGNSTNSGTISYLPAGTNVTYVDFADGRTIEVLDTNLQAFLNTHRADLQGATIAFNTNNAGKAISIKSVGLQAKSYTNAFIDALVDIDGITIQGVATVETDVAPGAVTVAGNNVTLRDFTITGNLVVNGDNFTSKDNHITGNVTVNGEDASFNTEIDGNVTVAANASATFSNVQFAATTVLTVTGEAKISGSTGDLVATNVTVTGTLDAKSASNASVKAKDNTATSELSAAKTALQTAVNNANGVQVVATSVDGSNVAKADKWTTEAAKTAFESAKTAAGVALNDNTKTAKELTAAKTTLETAVTTYNAAKANGLALSVSTLGTAVNQTQFLTSLVLTDGVEAPVSGAAIEAALIAKLEGFKAQDTDAAIADGRTDIVAVKGYNASDIKVNTQNIKFSADGKTVSIVGPVFSEAAFKVAKGAKAANYPTAFNLSLFKQGAVPTETGSILPTDKLAVVAISANGTATVVPAQ